MTGSQGPCDTHEVLNQPPPLAGSLMLRHAPPGLADAFCATRLADATPPQAYGALPTGLALTDIIAYGRVEAAL